MRARNLVVILALSLVAAACGGDDQATPSAADTDAPFGPGAVALIASSNLAVGTERVLITITDDQGRRLPSPEISVTLEFWFDGRESQRQSAEGIFMWAIPNVNGLYRATVELDVAGTWMVQVTPAGGESLEPTAVTVYDEPVTPAIGQPAPRSDTLTSADGPLDEISTDPEPDPSFYELTIAEAVTSGRPSVITFATPRFCTTAVCGPTLELMRTLAPRFPTVNFLHVEVFTNINDPDNLSLAPAVEEWGLPTEPWVFVVDAEGIVIARFEGLVAEEELAALLP
jgi:hypothetical protein